MKKLQHILMICAVATLSVFIGCNNDDNGGTTTDPRDEKGEALAGTWTVTSAEFENDSRADWVGATVTFSYDNESKSGKYTVSGVPSEAEGNNAAEVLGADGTEVSWNFAGENSTNTIVRNDGTEMTAEISGTTLTLTFQLSGVEDRVAGFDGNWEFVLTEN